MKVQIENNGQCFTFELDGSNWDKSGKFKREPWEYQGDIETCVNNETVNH